MQINELMTENAMSQVTHFRPCISGILLESFFISLKAFHVINIAENIQELNNCRPWLDEMNSTRANEQVREFIDGPEMTRVISDVNWRLGFASNIDKGE